MTRDPLNTVPRGGRQQGGFTLLEVMICLLLLIVSGAGGIAMVMAQIRSTSFAGSAQTATRLGQQVLDRTMLASFAVVATGAGGCVSPAEAVYATGDTLAGGTAGNSMLYTRGCAVTLLTTGMKVITVTVSWTEASGRQRTITLASQRAP